MGRAVGIDLGTTFSEVAVMQGGEPVVITGSEGTRALPSVVAISKKTKKVLAIGGVKQKVLAARLRAAQRVVRLHQEIERAREEIRHFAAELAVSNRRLQEAALTDPLTGLPNRRYAMDRLQQEWATSLRTERSLACLVIDVDEFKAINDGFGHDVGDTVLRQAALALKLGLREQDVLCRMGGDEFLAICPGSSLEQMLICGERVRQAVQDAPVNSSRLPLKITVSIGVSVRHPSMENVDALVKRADQSLYLAKERGRNCVAAV